MLCLILSFLIRVHLRTRTLGDEHILNPRRTDADRVCRSVLRGMARHGAAIPRRDVLPLGEGKLGQFVVSNLVPLSLPAPHVMLVLHGSELRGRTVAPSENVLRFVEVAVKLLGYLLPKPGDDGRGQLGISTPENKRVYLRPNVWTEPIAVQHMVFDKRQRLAGTGRSAQQPMWLWRFVKSLLMGIRFVAIDELLNRIVDNDAHASGSCRLVEKTIFTGPLSLLVISVRCVALPSRLS